jgi:hypothetical protein
MEYADLPRRRHAPRAGDGEYRTLLDSDPKPETRQDGAPDGGDLNHRDEAASWNTDAPCGVTGNPEWRDEYRHLLLTGKTRADAIQEYRGP